MTVEEARIKVRLDKLNIQQVRRELKSEQAFGMTDKIYGSKTRYNPDFQDPVKNQIPFGSAKQRIGEMH